MNSVLVVLPAYNEEKAVGKVVREIRSQGLPVLVVNDCSKDGTEQAARESGAEVLCHAENQGKGGAILSAIDYALSQGYTHILVLDADGQHAPSEIGLFLDALERTRADIVLGSRMHNPAGMPFVRLWTNRVMSLMVSILAGARITDSQCGYRLMSTESLRVVSLATRRYDAESEFLVKGCRLGFRLVEVPVSTIYGEETSTVNPFVDTIRFLHLLGRLMWWLASGRKGRREKSRAG